MKMRLTPLIHNNTADKVLLLPQYARVYLVATRHLGGKRQRLYADPRSIKLSIIRI
jgi:hypothetical protein